MHGGYILIYYLNNVCLVIVKMVLFKYVSLSLREVQASEFHRGIFSEHAI